ncbi:unnamed protein product, partial [Laminaria digitata]
ATQVKAVLGHLEDTLTEVSSLGQPAATTPLPGSGIRGSTAAPRAAAAAAGAAASAAVGRREPAARVGGTGSSGAAAGGVGGDAALPAWHQLLDRVRALAGQLQWAERATQRAADGRIHVTRDSAGTFLKPHAGSQQRRPRDLRVRALDPDHFTCLPPAHGAVHQQRPGTAPAEGHSSVSVADCRPPSGAPRAAEEAAEAAAAAAAAAATVALRGAGGDGRPGAVPAVHEMYHLDAASLGGFEEAAAAATRALGDLLTHVGGGGGGGGGRGGGGGGGVGGGGCGGGRGVGFGGGGGGGDGGGGVEQGVALLLLGVGGSSGGGSGGDRGGGAIVEAISDVRDSFRELVVAATALGVVVPCAPEGAGRKGTAVFFCACVCSVFRCAFVFLDCASLSRRSRDGSFGARTPQAPCDHVLYLKSAPRERPKPKCGGAASADSSGPSLRLLRGVKAAGGAEGARRLEALARRLPAERATLEAVAAAGVAEARQWRAAAVEQASAVLSLGE